MAWRRADRVRMGFTLIELLVVVAIIVVLIAILLPSLGLAKQQAQRARCSANLHNVALAYTVYAGTFSDRIPLGYTGGRWEGYMIYTGGNWSVLGGFYHAGLMNDPKAWYCSNQPDPRFQLNTKQNPWPPASGGSSFYRAGYQARPSIAWNGDKPSSGVWPRLQDLQNEAVMACVTGIPNTSSGQATLEPPHRAKICVLYGNQSVRPMDASKVMPYLQAINSGGSNPPASLYLDTSTTPAKGLWAEYDRN